MEFRAGQAAVRVNIRDEGALLAAVAGRLEAGEGFAVATLNLDHLVKLGRDPLFARAYAAQDLVTADGNPVVWLSRLAGSPVSLAPGADLLLPTLGLCAALGVPVALVGGTEAGLLAAERALDVPGLEVRLRRAPSMGLDPEGPEALALLDAVAASGARVAVLALGAPRQERLAALGRRRHPSLGFLSVGAALDFLGGGQRRAPPLLRRLALEWLWRMLLDPRRLLARYAACAFILPGLAAQALSRRAAAPRGDRAPGAGPPAAP